MHPFGEIERTPRGHFRLAFYAAVFRLIEQVHRLQGEDVEETFARFPFLRGYFEEMRPFLPADLTWRSAAGWWQAALAAWEADCPGHLPLRALTEAAGIGAAGLTALVIAGAARPWSWWGGWPAARTPGRSAGRCWRRAWSRWPTRRRRGRSGSCRCPPCSGTPPHASIGGVFARPPLAEAAPGPAVVLALLTWNTRAVSLESFSALLREGRMLHRLGLRPFLCVCDNGSTDGTAAALRQAEGEVDLPCRFIFNAENRGSSVARNQIIDAMLEWGPPGCRARSAPR